MRLDFSIMEKQEQLHPQRDEGASRSVIEPGKPVPINDLYERATELSPLEIARESASNKYLNERFSVAESRFWRLYWRPWPVTLGFGSAAVVLILLALFLAEIAGVNAVNAPVWFKLLRVAFMFGGFICLMTAAPLYKQRGWSPEKETAEYEELESFRRRYSRMPFTGKKGPRADSDTQVEAASSDAERLRPD